MVKGHSFQNVRITNLSLTGCFAIVSRRDAALFDQGTLLEQFAFEHADLASGTFTAKVMYSLGASESPSGLDLVGLGIHFLALDTECQKTLENFLALH